MCHWSTNDETYDFNIYYIIQCSMDLIVIIVNTIEIGREEK